MLASPPELSKNMAAPAIYMFSLTANNIDPNVAIPQAKSKEDLLPKLSE